MNFRLICFIWAGLTLGTLSGQDCQITVRGILKGESSQQPLAYASVQIKEIRKGTFTDSTGHFEISGLCPDTYTFICDHVACEHLEVTTYVGENTETKNFTLIHHEQHLDEVIILGNQQRGPPTESVAQIEGLELAENEGKSLGDILTNMPGVNALRTGPTIVKPVIHGLHSNRVLILNNGIRQEGQQWGSEHAPEIDPFIANKLTVIKGANSLRYGPGAIGGVILVEPEEMRDSAGVGAKVHMVGQSNGRLGIISGHIEGKVPNFRPLSWRIQGTLKKGGNLRSPDYFLENSGQQEENFSANLHYETFAHGIDVFYSRFHSRLGILSSAHLGGRSDLERALASPIPLGADTVDFTYDIRRPYQDITHNLVKVKNYWRLADIGKVNLIYAYQANNRQEFDKHKPRGVDDNGEDIAELEFKINTHTLEANLKHELTPRIEGLVGTSGIYQNNRLRGRMFIPNYILIGGEVFWIERWKGEKLDIEAGVRYDYRWINSAREKRGVNIFSIREYQSISANVGAIYEVNRKLSIRANLGRAWRPPHVNELFSDGLHHGAGAFEKGDSTLSPEEAVKLVSDLTYNGRRFKAVVTLYQQWFRNFIYRRPGGIERTIRGAFPSFQYDQTAASLTGADLNMSFEMPFGLRWQGKASYLRAWNTSEDEPLIFMPANWFSNSLQYNLPVSGRLSDAYVKVTWRHVFEQTNVPTGENPIERDWRPPPPAYDLVGLDLGTRLDFGKQSLRVILSVDNLFNVTYRDYLNRFRYYADEPGRNISLRLTYHFKH